MNITCRQLRLFMALAETGSVSAAARAMHVTQPTASMQLREISESVGLPVYDVVARKIHLTEAGQRLACTARAIMDEWDGYEQQVNALKGLTRGRLRVAVVSTAKYFVPRLLGSFCEQHPGIDISLEVLNRDRVVQRLRENRDDLYVLSQPPADMDLADHAILSNPLVLIAPCGHPFSGRKRIALKALQGERFILRESGSGTRLSTDRFFRQQTFMPERLLELGSNEAIKEAVAGHLGVAILSQHALRTDMDQDELCILPVTGFPIRSHWHVVYPRARQLPPVAEVFLKSLLAQAQP